MMKLGCMSLSYQRQFAARQLDLDGFIERAYGLGLDGIDIHTGAFAATDPAYLRGIRMRALKRGIALSYIGVSSNFGKPAAQLPDEVATAKRWIDTAAFMLVRTDAGGTPLKTFVVGANASGSNTGSFVINDLGTAVSGAGTLQLTVGDNPVHMVVTAENGTQRTYELLIVRKSGPLGPTATPAPSRPAGSPPAAHTATA